ncbi:high-affinity iron permease [Quaeritorhiza haematococci]|nr:high-affinity iron permease [Quaeritorhiza haematococci]
MGLFNVGAFFVLFREALEAAIILGVLLQYVNRCIPNNPSLLRSVKRQVWIGTAVGLAISVLIGIAFTVVFYVLKQDVFGPYAPIFEGSLMSLAVIMLTWLAFSMIRITAMQDKWERKISRAAEEKNLEGGIEQGGKGMGQRWGFMILTFTVVIREGLESVIFIAGVGQGDPKALIIPGLLGIFLGILIGYLLYRSSTNLNLRIFFVISSAVLFVLAAGLAANASSEFEEVYYLRVVNNNVEGAGEEGETVIGMVEDGETGGFEGVPESSRIVWDASGCCSEKRNGFFQVLNTLVGWRAQPTVVTTAVYFSYWGMVMLLGALMWIKNRRSK